MRKLSFEENLRHRLRELPTFHYREKPSRSEGALFLAAGAVAGLAAGMFIAQRYGGFAAVTSRLRDRLGPDFLGGDDDATDEDALGEDDELGDDFEDDALAASEELEERVLEAYHNDPVLSERPIDIGAIDEGMIELTGWVQSADEASHAVTVARGTPGVETVVNRLAVRSEEDDLDGNAERYGDGDPSLTEAHWEGQQVGIGRTRQGNSSQPGRHADPKPLLEDRWMEESEAYREAADDVQGLAERRKRGKSAKKGGETDGSPTAPSGVPKADHVADPEAAPQTKGTGDTNSIRGG